MKALTLALSLILASNLYASCQDELYTFKVKNSSKASVTILDVLEGLTNECKMSIVFSDEEAQKRASEKKVTYMNVKDMPLESLLKLLLEDNNLFFTIDDSNILKISYLKTQSFYIDYVNFSTASNESSKTISTGSKGSESNGKDSTKLDFKTEFKFWDNIQSEADNILKRSGDYEATSTLNKEAGVLTVTGTKAQIDRVSKYIKKITDRLHKQIMIDAKIIEVTYDVGQTTGINWSKFQAQLAAQGKGLDQKGVEHTLKNPLSMFGYNYTMEGLLDFLKTQGDVSIVSNPRILALNNQPAIINVGEEKNYKFTTGSTTTTTNGVVQSDPQYEVGSTFVGVTLAIVPEVTRDNQIILKINPTISEISNEHKDANGNPNLAPDIKIKQLSSIIKVKNQEQVIIGGLVQKRIENKETKIPVLGNIPLFGKAFRSNSKVKSKSELIIVMTPKLVSGDRSTQSLGDLEAVVDHNEYLH